MRTLKSNFRPFPWQSAVIKGVFENWKGSIHIVKSKRQCGKSIMLENIVLKTAVEKPNSISFILSPTFNQSRKIYKELTKAIQDTFIFEGKNNSILEIYLTNGSEIHFASAEQRDGLRGNTVSGILAIDEGCFISDDIFYEVTPWVNAYKAPIVVTSSPKFKTGFFYNLFLLGLTNNDQHVYSYDFCAYDTSCLLTPKILERYRKALPKDVFQCEYLGEFIDGDGGVFGDFEQLIGGIITPNLQLYMGIDWSTGTNQDETAISIFNSHHQQVGLFHFSDKDATETIEYIVKLIEQYKPVRILVEKNSIGQVFYDLLKREIKNKGIKTSLSAFVTSNTSKEKLIQDLQVAIQNKEVQFLVDEDLKLQLTMYQAEVTSSGKRQYNAPAGYHDDLVIATLLSYSLTNKPSYTII